MRKLKARLFYIGSGVLGMVSAAYLHAVFRAGFFKLPPAQVAGLAVMFLGAWYGTNRLRLYVKRHSNRGFAPPAAAVLKKDTRPPILVLRAFDDDERFIVRRSFFAMQKTARTIKEEVSLEELVTGFLHDAGPVIAIGKPGERTPALGAARLYAGDDWQDRVRELIMQSTCFAAFLGTGRGLVWEFEQIFELDQLHKAIFVFPPLPIDEVNRSWRIVARAISQSTSVTLPYDLPRDAAFMTFDPERRFEIHQAPKLRKSWWTRRYCADDYQAAMQIALADGSRVRLKAPASTPWYNLRRKVWVPVVLLFGALAILSLIGAFSGKR